MAKTKNWLNKTEFAKLCGENGVSVTAINKAIDRGEIRVDSRTGKLDPETPLNRKYISKFFADKPDNGQEVDIKTSNLHSLGLEKLKERKLIAQIEARELQTDIERGKYLESDLVEKFFRELLAIDQKALLNVGKRTAPAILALTGSEESHQPAIVTEIDGEIWKVIEQKKRKIEDFLTSLKDNE